MRYELFYLIGASREADAEKIKEDIMKLVTEAGGVFEEKETIEKRRLAYQIKHETHGIFIAQRFELDTEKIPELSKKINLYPNLTRFIISKANELPELKTKEERISESMTRPAPVKEVEKKIETPAKKEEVKEDTKKEESKEKPASDDDIDKKLEEILNI
ncbi:MAG: 30S ribosomal protein S6 [Parcubacteria group bacterium]